MSPLYSDDIGACLHCGALMNQPPSICTTCRGKRLLDADVARIAEAVAARVDGEIRVELFGKLLTTKAALVAEVTRIITQVHERAEKAEADLRERDAWREAVKANLDAWRERAEKAEAEREHAIKERDEAHHVLSMQGRCINDLRAQLDKLPKLLRWTRASARQPPGGGWYRTRRGKGVDNRAVYWSPDGPSLPACVEWAGPLPEPAEGDE